MRWSNREWKEASTEHSRPLLYVRYAAWVCLVLALLCAAAQCIWKPLFVGRHVAGIYWLFIALDQIVPPLTGLLALGFVVVLAELTAAIRWPGRDSMEFRTACRGTKEEGRGCCSPKTPKCTMSSAKLTN